MFVVYDSKRVCTYTDVTWTVKNVWSDELHGPEEPSLFTGQASVATTTWFRLHKP